VSMTSTLDRKLRVVERLLDSAADDPLHREEATALLASVESALGQLLREVDTDAATAGRLLGLRDDLGGYLLAAAHLDAVGGPPDTAVDLLRRATEATGEGLRILLLLRPHALAGRG
jgi:hypothetical protein